MKKFIVFICISILSAVGAINFFGQSNDIANQQVDDTTNASSSRFGEPIINPDRGFFQKAYTDKDEAHFTVEDKKHNFRFGIGGTVHFTAFYDFNGAVASRQFSPWNISVPTDYAGHFGYSIGSTKLHFKTVGKLGKRSCVAFIEIGMRPTANEIVLRHAYFSYGGLTIGQTWSQFMDLSAGVMTVDLEGPNTQIASLQPLVAYTFPLPKQWQVAFSAELPSFSLNYGKEGSYGYEYQFLPDFVAHSKYQGKMGHVQVAAILRTLRYVEFDNAEEIDSVNLGATQETILEEYTSKQQFGYGIALSGSLRPCKGLLLSAQCVLGKGISQYINDLGKARLDMARMIDHSGNQSVQRIAPIPVLGGYATIQYSWKEKFTVSLVYGLARLLQEDKIEYNQADCGDFYASHYLAANFFWMVNNDFTIGAEYLYGQRTNRNWQDGFHSGHANRINMMLTYSF